MIQYKSEFLKIIHERGFIHQISEEAPLDQLSHQESVSGYVGFDCTAPSPHIGNLISMMMLYWMQQTGHRPIILIGGGTTRIGDPSGRDEARQLLSEEKIAENTAAIKDVFGNLLNIGEGEDDALMVDNSQWLLNLDLLGFLRDVGRHFSVNQMLQRDSIRLRIERSQHLSYLEFSYMLLQAFDFVELHRRYGCQLQMGGSDQWGNIMSGIDLGRRLEGANLFGLTSPLITTADGQKMGKSVDGAVWLAPQLLSDHDYWQFWRNTADRDVERFLKLYTALPLAQIASLAKLQGAELNEAKKILADEATRLIRGDEAARTARMTAEKTFEQGQISSALPQIQIAGQELQEGYGILRALVSLDFCASNGEARRLVRGGGVRLNDQVIKDDGYRLLEADFAAGGNAKLSAGKKRHGLISKQ